jgi:DNA-binding CsgD family transcriptional regulator
VLFAKYLDGTPAHDTGTSELTAREREIVQLLAEGKSNKEVASVLGISVKTVETHRASIMKKLRCDSFAALVRYAIRQKIVQS